MAKKTTKKKTAKKAQSVRRKCARRKPPADKYDRRFVPLAAKYARLGLTVSEMADLFGVTIATIGNWKKSKLEFAKALDAGAKAAEIDKVEIAFIKKAQPHDETEEQHLLRGRGRNKKMTLIGKKIKKRVIDSRAAERLLRAHKPEIYGDKLELPSGVNVKINISKKYADSNRTKKRS